MAALADKEYAELAQQSADASLKKSFEVYSEHYGLEEGIKKVLIITGIMSGNVLKNDEVQDEDAFIKRRNERGIRVLSEFLTEQNYPNPKDAARRFVCQ